MSANYMYKAFSGTNPFTGYQDVAPGNDFPAPMYGAVPHKPFYRSVQPPYQTPYGPGQPGIPSGRPAHGNQHGPPAGVGCPVPRSGLAPHQPPYRPVWTNGFVGRETTSHGHGARQNAGGAVRVTSPAVRVYQHFSPLNEKKEVPWSKHPRLQSLQPRMTVSSRQPPGALDGLKPTTLNGVKVGEGQNRVKPADHSHQPGSHLQSVSDPTIQRLVDFEAKLRSRGRDGARFRFPSKQRGIISVSCHPYIFSSVLSSSRVFPCKRKYTRLIGCHWSGKC